MYKPNHSIPLDTQTETQIRLGLQGYGGTGKTWAALTFPNPTVVNLDRGLRAHLGRKDVIELPFYNTDFCKKVNPSYKDYSWLRETLLNWLKTEGQKLEADQTLVWDGGTGTQNAYHAWYRNNRVYAKSSGEEDKYAQWNKKLDFFTELCEEFKKLQCHVVYVCHEAEKKDKVTQEYTGKIRPLLTGAFGDELITHFTDWFRMHSADKPADFSTCKPFTLDSWGMTPAQFQAFCNTFPRKTIYYMQTEGDDKFDGKCSSLHNFPRFIPADYKSFIQYRRQVT